MRIRQALFNATVSMAVSIISTPPAHAQSNYDPAAGGMPLRSYTRFLPQYRFDNSYRRFNGQQYDQGGGDEVGLPESEGPFRTMCVRTCDGYYFPLSHGARRENFTDIAKSCRAACGDEARMFYYPLDGGSVDTMVDLAGRKYSELPHAFAYRKALAKGCACKPQPWSGQEAWRHRGYEIEARERAAHARDLDGATGDAPPPNEEYGAPGDAWAPDPQEPPFEAKEPSWPDSEEPVARPRPRINRPTHEALSGMSITISPNIEAIWRPRRR